jgi:hypothetical protein
LLDTLFERDKLALIAYGADQNDDDVSESDATVISQAPNPFPGATWIEVPPWTPDNVDDNVLINMEKVA